MDEEDRRTRCLIEVLIRDVCIHTKYYILSRIFFQLVLTNYITLQIWETTKQKHTQTEYWRWRNVWQLWGWLRQKNAVWFCSLWAQRPNDWPSLWCKGNASLNHNPFCLNSNISAVAQARSRLWRLEVLKAGRNVILGADMSGKTGVFWLSPSFIYHATLGCLVYGKYVRGSCVSLCAMITIVGIVLDYFWCLILWWHTVARRSQGRRQIQIIQGRQ